MTSAFDATFAAVRAIFKRYEPACVVLHDEPGKYYLGTHEVRAKDGYRTWFGGCEIKKSYVSVHLIPIYAHPELAAGISAALARRKQGKSCFNLKKNEPELVAELAGLVESGFKRFKKDGRI